MNFVWNELSFTELIISSSILFVILLTFFLLILGTTHRVATYIVLGIGASLLIYGFIFMQNIAFFSGVVIVTLIEGIALTVNGKYFLKYFSDAHKPKIEEHINFDEEIYNSLSKAVTYLSKNHIGGLITIERTDDLTPYYEKNGIKVNAPVTEELLETIFYTGSRLHDGAVIIQKNKIMAASVFYSLSTKRYQSKLGSRHRAALGIAETTDSLSIVVSEETGQVSFAMNSCLETVANENISKMLKLFMESDQGGDNGRK